MKCECDECNGTGRIECPECEGNGYEDRDIGEAKLDEWHPRFEELNSLREDARRVIKQEEALTALNPGREASYKKQLKATLWIINKEADAILKT